MACKQAINIPQTVLKAIIVHCLTTTALYSAKINYSAIKTDNFRKLHSVVLHEYKGID